MLQGHRDLKVYQLAYDLAMEIFRLSKRFPREEIYSLTDQIRKSSRSVCANLAEAWRRRRYIAAFDAKIDDSEGEAAETQVWIEFALGCNYLDRATAKELYQEYEEIIALLVSMINNHDIWLLPSALRRK